MPNFILDNTALVGEKSDGEYLNAAEFNLHENALEDIRTILRAGGFAGTVAPVNYSATVGVTTYDVTDAQGLIDWNEFQGLLTALAATAGAVVEVDADATHAGRVTLFAQQLGAGEKIVDALTSTGTLTAPGVLFAADGDWAGRSTNNSVLFDATTGDAVLRGSGNVVVAIDSNSNETDQRFIVQHNSSAFGGTELFSIAEDGTAVITGTLNVTSAGGLTVNSVVVPTLTSISTLSSKTLTAPVINAATLTGVIATGTSTFTGTNLAGMNTGDAPITAKDEGVTLTAAATSFDFVGGGVVATNVGGAVTVTIGAGSGVTTMSAVGAVANTDGASISGSTLTLQPASASFPGVITAAQFTKLAGIATGATAEVDADGTHAGRVTLSAQQLGTGNKYTLDNFGVGIIPTTDLHVEKATAAAGTVQALVRNATANGLAQVAVKNSSDATAALEILGSGFSTTARPTTANMAILRGGTTGGGVAIQAAASDTPIEFWTNIAGTHAKRGEFRGSDGALIIIGDVSGGSYFTNADTALVGRSTNNSILFNSTTGDGIARATGNFYVAIDSNNNETTAKFSVQKDSNAAGSGTELFSITEAGVTTVTGTFVVTGATATVNSVAVLTQTNTVTGITGKTFGATTFSSTISAQGAVTFGAQNVYKGGTGITAFATGGQASATALPNETNFVTTVASAADSVKLPTMALGTKVVVFNLGANACNVYPQTSGAIDALGTNNPYSLGAGLSREFHGQSTTQWRSK